MKLGHLNAGVVKITRNITEYGGISRNMAEYHGIYLDITIFFDGSHAKLFINIKHGRLTTYFDYKSNNNNNNKLYLKKVQLYKNQFSNANLTLGLLFNCYRPLITNLL